ncbi:MAG: TetR/AcrR family transcriptional regulator [Actinomycetia bacterium]|nr:TetR/AcrR family transcriptional regulator [Actinomycetes bacterium]
MREHGLAKTTSRLIATTAGANLGAITYYFASKDDLLAEALFGELAARLTPVMENLQDSDQPATTRLVSAVQALIAEFERSAEEVPVYLNALMLSTEPGPLAERAHTMLTQLRAKLAEVISELKGEGVIAAWVEPDAMASLLIATGNGIALQSQLDPEGATVSVLAGQLAGLLLAASPGPDHSQ